MTTGLLAGLLVLASVAEGHTQETPAGPAEADQASETEQAADEQPSSLTDVVVVTASRREEQLINAPATITVLTAEMLENSPGHNVADLLRAVPGLNTAQTSARDVNLTTRAATGTLSDSHLAVIDGRAVYQDFFGFVLWDLIPNTDEIKQVEIIRGPASAVWGANAMSGVVNVITKTPREMLGTTVSLGLGQFGRSLTGEDFSSGGLFTAHATYAAAPNDRLAYKLSAGLLTQEALPRPTGTVPGTGAPYPSFTNRGTTQPRFDARVDYDFPDGRQGLTVSGGVAGTDGIIHSGLGPFDIQPGTRLSHGKVNYTRGEFQTQFFVNAFNGDAPALLQRTGDDRVLPFTVKTLTYDVSFSNAHILGTRHLLSYGGNFRHTGFDLSLAPDGSSRDEGGFYVQDTIFLSDRFRWVIGTRVDRFDILDGTVRLTLPAAQWRDAYSSIPLPSASLSVCNHQPRRVVVPQIRPELPGCRGSAGRTRHHRVARDHSAVVREVRPRLRPAVEATSRSTRRYVVPGRSLRHDQRSAPVSLACGRPRRGPDRPPRPTPSGRARGAEILSKTVEESAPGTRASGDRQAGQLPSRPSGGHALGHP